jgi:hypothetical protein
MSLAEKMASWRRMKEREEKERETVVEFGVFASKPQPS